MNTPIFIIDFDSTLVQCESLDELARIALADRPDRDTVMAELEAITRQGMEGALGFDESLRRRVALFQANRGQIAALVEQLNNQISASVLRQREWLAKNAQHIYVISGGFADYIVPVMAKLDIPADRVLANRFTYDESGVITGYDSANVLSQSGGKARQVALLGLTGPGSSGLSESRPVIVIGDGYTDYDIKAQGYADEFWAFTENVQRPSVVAVADKIVNDFALVAER